MDGKKKPSKGSILLKMPPWLKFGVVAILGSCAFYYQITTMKDYQKLMQGRDFPNEVPRYARVGNYEGTNSGRN